jgi:hypothetical protein
MNRREMLAGVMGLCAGLPFVGRFVPKLKVVSTYILMGVDISGDEHYAYCSTCERLSDGTSRLIENWRHKIERSEPPLFYMSNVDDPNNWDYSPITMTKTASTESKGVTLEWFRG